MKSYISKFLLGGAVIAMLGMTACVGDLDQEPKDVTLMSPDEIAKNSEEYVASALAKCYSGLAISGQTGAGSSDISGLDNGRSCWSRAIFMLNEFTTDECSWIWKDSGIFDLVTDTWATNNENIFGTYSRLYTHVAICNEFLRLVDNADDYGIKIEGRLAENIEQFRLEARALRGLSYFYIIDLFGNAALSWDNQAAGEAPVPTTRAALFNTVTADLEDVLAKFDKNQNKANVVYGRIGVDAVEALLAKYYLNAEQWTGTAQWQKCWDHCKNVIDRHGNQANNYGLAKDYLSIFCGNNHIFAPGGSLAADQNEILWNIPYEYRVEANGLLQDATQSYGGTSFLILAALSDQTTATPGWFGMNGQWTCMHARTQFSEKFNFSGGKSADGRTYLWFTDSDGFKIDNTDFSTYKDGYVPCKFTNVLCDASTGEMPRFKDYKSGLNRCGVHTEEPVYDKDGNLSDIKIGGIDASATFANTDYPIIRLAEILLTAAEANLRGNVGSSAEALNYVNAVRNRAGGVEAWNTANLNLDNLLDERARELYWENCRRTDLIRFGKFTGSAYNWNWKGNVPGGASMSSHMNLYPIPTSVINSYSVPYPQNPGY